LFNGQINYPVKPRRANHARSWRVTGRRTFLQERIARLGEEQFNSRIESSPSNSLCGWITGKRRNKRFSLFWLFEGGGNELEFGR
jgi:hypothetical protein